jgi:hypothetical protein
MIAANMTEKSTTVSVSSAFSASLTALGNFA